MRGSVSSPAANIDHILLNSVLRQKAIHFKMILEVSVRKVRINPLAPGVITRPQKVRNPQSFVSHFVREIASIHRRSLISWRCDCRSSAINTPWQRAQGSSRQSSLCREVSGINRVSHVGTALFNREYRSYNDGQHQHSAR